MLTTDKRTRDRIKEINRNADRELRKIMLVWGSIGAILFFIVWFVL